METITSRDFKVCLKCEILFLACHSTLSVPDRNLFPRGVQIIIYNNNAFLENIKKKFNRLSSHIVSYCLCKDHLIWSHSFGELNILPQTECDIWKTTKEHHWVEMMFFPEGQAEVSYLQSRCNASYSQCFPLRAGEDNWKGRCQTKRYVRCHTIWSSTLQKTQRLLGIVLAAAKHSQETSRTKETGKRSRELSKLT